MSCALPYEIFKEYPNTVILSYFSSAMTDVIKTDADKDAYITNNHIGYVTEMERLGNSATTGPGSPNNVSANPYSTRLRPVRDADKVINAQKVFLEKVEFYAYDATLAGSDYQDEDVAAIITAGISTEDAYPRSHYRNAMLPINFQPNYFSPVIKIDGKDIIGGANASNYGNKANKGDLSIGFPLPLCLDIYREFGKISSIEVFGKVAMAIDNGSLVNPVTYYQQFPIQAILYFRTGTGTKNVKTG